MWLRPPLPLLAWMPWLLLPSCHTTQCAAMRARSFAYSHVLSCHGYCYYPTCVLLPLVRGDGLVESSLGPSVVFVVERLLDLYVLYIYILHIICYTLYIIDHILYIFYVMYTMCGHAHVCPLVGKFGLACVFALTRAFTLPASCRAWSTTCFEGSRTSSKHLISS